MRPNYKFHAIALSGICAAITVMYFLFAPGTEAPVVDNGPQGDRYIQIYSATWGMDCNDYIRQEMAARSKAPVEKNEKGEIVQKEPLTLVTENNVLPAISSLCDGKLSCDVNGSSDALGKVEPMASCFKKLEIKYRCFSFDRLRTISVEQKNSDTIDCEKDDAAESAEAPKQ